MRENKTRKYLQLLVIHETFIRGGPAIYVLYLIRCSKNDATITCLWTKTSLERLWASAIWNRWCADIFMQHAVNLRLSVFTVYIMVVQWDGRSPDPSEEVKSRAVAEPESYISAVLLQGKGQIKTLTEQGRVTRQRQGWVNFLSKRDGEGCHGFGLLPKRRKCYINL